jgi:hypothetical protein
MVKGELGSYWKANEEERGGSGGRETQMKVGGWCRIGLEECWCEEMQNKIFGQNRMGM